MKRQLATIALAVACAIVGAAGGWIAATRGHEPDGSTDTETAAGAPVLSAATLKTIGVEIAPLETNTYTQTREVQAVVVDRPISVHPVRAPLGGYIKTLQVQTGMAVAAGEALVTLVRDPIPRPKPELTADLLTPVSEQVHEAVNQARTAAKDIELVKTELERIRSFTRGSDEPGSLPVLPLKTEIDLRYELAKAEQRLANGRSELLRHGLTEEEIEACQAGAQPPANHELWKSALSASGLWPPEAAAVYQQLDETQRSKPWSIVAIGELAAAGLLTPAFPKVLAESPSMVEHFIEVAGLRLDGMPLETIRHLADGGALAPIVVLRAPVEGIDDWDVIDVHVRPEQRVDTGEELLVLHDARIMWLRLEPIGSEIGAVAQALGDGTSMRGEPQVPGSGPVLEDLVIHRIATNGGGDDDHPGSAAAYIPVENHPLTACSQVGHLCRTWALRSGTRYMIRVPVEAFQERFVLPRAAVTEDGPDRVVLLQDGKAFRSVPVHVEFETDQVSVVANDGAIFPGEVAVMNGAFELGLALQRSQGKELPADTCGCGQVH